MRLDSELWVSRPRHEVFRYFHDASVLEVMSPPWVQCKMLTPGPVEMRLNARIEYRFRLHGIPFRWEALVTAWNPPYQFVDEQKRGPYRRWKHTHTFVEDNGGTLIKDDIEFEVPFPKKIIGWLVARDLRKIFSFRQHALLRIFEQRQPGPKPTVAVLM